MKTVFSHISARIIFAAFLTFIGISGSFSQVSNPGPAYTPTSVIFTNPAANQWVVPSGVATIYVDGVAPGGSGGGGTVTGGNAGGAGGGYGASMLGWPLSVTPGATLTITIGAVVAGGAVDTDGNTGNNVTITGAIDTFPQLQGGSKGLKGATGVGGASTAGAGVGGATAAAAAANGVRPSALPESPYYIGGGSGGGGGSTASGGGLGLGTIGFGPNGTGTTSAGTGNASGAGGSSGRWGMGGVGGNGTVPSVGAAPTIGYGGGGGGGGPGLAGGAGGPGWVRIRY